MKATPAIAGAVLTIALVGPIQAETLLIDFGNDDSFRGLSVVNPDPNGNTWNSVRPGAFWPDLVDRTNGATPIDFGFSSAVATDSFNGPAGVTATNSLLTDVLNTRIDPAALGDLGVTHAAFDFVGGSNVTFVIQGLDAAKVYDLTFYGGHKFTATNVTTYGVYTDNGYGALVASVDLDVGAGDAHNSNTVAVITNLTPQAGNALYIQFGGVDGVNPGYLNAMAIDEKDPPPPPPVQSGDQTILIDFGDTNSYRGASVTGPDSNGSTWNSVWAGAFYSGLLDISNQATSVAFGFVSAGGSDYFNGPSGAVEDPAAVVIDAAALGLLGGANEAVYDYYGSSSFQLEGLDSNKTYNLTFFGSHKFTTDDTTVYEIHSDGDYTNAIASAGLVVGVNAAHNSNTVVTIEGLQPQTTNHFLYVKYEGADGNSGYLNALRIDVFDADPYGDWAEGFPTLTGGPYDDDDMDGVINLHEYGSGGNPTNAADLGYVPTYEVADVNGSNEVVVVFARRTGDSGLSYYLEQTTDLVANTWTNTGYTELPLTGALDPDFEAVTNQVPAEASETFIRIVIEPTP